MYVSFLHQQKKNDLSIPYHCYSFMSYGSNFLFIQYYDHTPAIYGETGVRQLWTIALLSSLVESQDVLTHLEDCQQFENMLTSFISNNRHSQLVAKKQSNCNAKKCMQQWADKIWDVLGIQNTILDMYVVTAAGMFQQLFGTYISFMIVLHFLLDTQVGIHYSALLFCAFKNQAHTVHSIVIYY